MKPLKLITMFILIVAICCFAFWDFPTSSSKASKPKTLSETELESRFQIREHNRRIQKNIRTNTRTIDNLNDSIKTLNNFLKAFHGHTPTLKNEIAEIQKKKQQAIFDNDFTGYVAQDSIYMDSITTMLTLYESAIAMHEKKSSYQDSVISNYISIDSLKNLFFENEQAYLQSLHRTEIDKLTRKLKRVKKQRNFSLIGNAILTAIIFWKK